MKKIEEIIKNTNEENQEKINWTNAWSQKYPVLSRYQSEVNVKKYSKELRILLEMLKNEYNYNELDSMLVLKDILYHEWRENKSKVDK